MEDLFARLQKVGSSASDKQQSPSTVKPQTYRDPSLSSPVYSTAPFAPQPHRSSSIPSPNLSAMDTPQPEGVGTQTRATDLLSLLKFRPSPGSASTLPTSTFEHRSTPLDTKTGGTKGRVSSTADLISQFNRPPNTSQPLSTFAPAASQLELRDEEPASSSSPQDFLLKLLNQAPPKSSLAESSLPPTRFVKGSGLQSEGISDLHSSAGLKTQRSPSGSEYKSKSPLKETHRETISEALGSVGEVVEKQFGQAMVQETSKTNGDSEPKVSEAAQPIKAETNSDIEVDDRRKVEERGASNSTTAVIEEIIDPVSKPTEAEDWEAAARRGATTYTLPMQPFKSIIIRQFEKNPPLFPPSMTLDIARVKRPFDQIDRNLVAATPNLMIYPLKNGGLRVIRQETGVHKEVFKQLPERFFNVAVSAKKKIGMKDIEVVLATGVEGSVLWAPLSNFAASDDAEGDDADEVHGLIFPPVPSSDENTAGGQLKTRVKLSCRHPEYFAYGRGKSIYIVYPRVARSPAYCDPKTHVCNSEKYLKEHMLRISTGKAGKDFIFSSDDSLIISLDKAGRLKFWDIRNLVNEGKEKNDAVAVPLDVKVPLMTLATCPTTEKSWPTSIHLIDKDKPMTKGLALRYVIIGLKQNHSLQLWDLMLGKPVQEINFPHEQESDAICSVVFHAKTSILTVAHPTRNSIYFLHLSIPQYTLTPMNQSKFISMVADKHESLPPPQSTIIVNGIREYKFSLTSTIRSMDILAEPGSHYGDDMPAFVLYIMHSHGISEVKVDRAMLGLSETSRVVTGTSALDVKDAIKVGNIRPLPPAIAGDTGSVTSETMSVAPSNGVGEARKGGRRVEHAPTQILKAQNKEAESSTEKAEKKRKKKEKSNPQGQEQPTKAPAAPSFAPLEEFSKSAAETGPSKTRILTRKQNTDTETADAKGTVAYSEVLSSSSQDGSALAHSITRVDFKALEALLKSEFESLQGGITEDRLKQDAVAAARQEAVLKAVSRTLTENVEDSLTRVVTDGLTKIAISPLKDIIASTIDKQLASSFNQAMKVGVPRELQKSLPVAVSQTLKDKDVLQSVAEQISHNVAQQVDTQFKVAMQNTITPAISKLTIEAVKQMTSEIERRFGEHIHAHEILLQKNESAIQGLFKAIENLQRIIVDMSQVQRKCQQEIVEMLEQIRTAPVTQAQSTTPAPVTPAKPMLSLADLERVEIQNALSRGGVEEATLKWMHSERKVELFDEVFVFVDPQFLNTLSPLLILSVAATVSEDFRVHLRERLHWVDHCLGAIDSGNANELHDVLPNVLDVILQRIQHSYMQASQVDFQDPSLKNMHLVARKINELKTKVST
ncbi:uncharacterized protein PV09_09661 [Verruconis gallopava]|uniref:EDC4-like protein pdc1 beta-propeller domain-containing protein n=1 Tax=Verruconis gallopava TaxID=253628 RepID=A0A0D2AI12_9PEZI|nr:uncharacterized protein PV09_09661 [Verruconis gallopava]KIV98538.1 hypothetical protein PV09_09661 [Verruconis gallopava]